MILVHRDFLASTKELARLLQSYLPALGRQGNLEKRICTALRPWSGMDSHLFTISSSLGV